MTIRPKLVRVAAPLAVTAALAYASVLFTPGNSQAQAPTAPANQLPPALAKANASNAAWLGHAFVTTQAVINNLPASADFLTSHQVTTWYINIGLMDKEGKIIKGAAAFPKVKEFLAAVDAWEKKSGQKVKIYAWFNGSMDEASQRYIDLGKKDVRATMVSEVNRMVDPAAADSFVAGTSRKWDGVQFDLEPSGKDEVRFANLRTFMREVKAQVGPQVLTSFTAHKLGVNQGRYWWSPEFVYQMGADVDELCIMSYDTGLKEAGAYEKWMSQQTTMGLRSITGSYWKNDAAHPARKKNATLVIGFPGFPANNWHVLEAETMTAAARGTWTGLTQLQNEPSALAAFGGAAVYLYTDGTGKDNYSSPEDWAAFKTHWLKK